MKILLDTLGEEGTKRFLTFALPHIQQRNKALLACLMAQDWQQAAAHAHSIKGTVNLYGSNCLLEQLEKIIQYRQESIDIDQLMTTLTNVLETAEIEISQYLSKT
jgi:HPt (histidine-containing phosphotransfer) domain-containing protein